MNEDEAFEAAIEAAYEGTVCLIGALAGAALGWGILDVCARRKGAPRR